MLGLYKGAQNTLAASRFLLADTPNYPARKAELALAVSPLNRVLLDALCSIVFLFGELTGRTRRFYKAGWREMLEETNRIRDEYGNDEDWSAYLDARDQLILHAKELAGISASEEGNPREVPYWPIPSQMVAQSGAHRKPFMKYLYDWYYKSLSQDAHFAWAGVARSLPLLMNDGERQVRSERIEMLRSRQIAIGLTLMMAIITELEVELRFGLMERCKYVWAVLSTWSDEARELYDRFYRGIVGSASAEFPHGSEAR